MINSCHFKLKMKDSLQEILFSESPPSNYYIGGSTEIPPSNYYIGGSTESPPSNYYIGGSTCITTSVYRVKEHYPPQRYLGHEGNWALLLKRMLHYHHIDVLHKLT